MIGVTAYMKAHRKSQDLLLSLKDNGYHNIKIIWQEWIERPARNPLYPHRPQLINDMDTVDLARYLGYSECEPGECRMILIGGANLLGDEYWGKAINSHPGYLPYVRGLDALKWAVLKELPFGVTTHMIDKEPDAGVLIDREIFEPEDFEDFYHFAIRLYKREIDMLVESVNREPGDRIRVEGYPVHRRMTNHDEIKMMNKYRRRNDT